MDPQAHPSVPPWEEDENGPRHGASEAWPLQARLACKIARKNGRKTISFYNFKILFQRWVGPKVE